jgi:hypothetical protein
LIARYVPPYGLAPKRWEEQAEEIRRLPETPPAPGSLREGD